MHSRWLPPGIRRAVFSPLAFLVFAVAPRAGAVAIDGRTLTTSRHVFSVDAIGLPSQIAIRPHSDELPLAARKDGLVPDADLPGIGRGPQLRAPVRLEALIDGVAVVAEAVAEATLEAVDGGVAAGADWTAGVARGSLRMRYGADGSMTGLLTCNVDQRIARLDLVFDLDGLIDTAIAGRPAAPEGVPAPMAYGHLPPEPGLLWRNGAAAAGDGSGHAGLVRHFFLGSGDRGLTWLVPSDTGYVIDPREPSISVERGRDGGVTWRVALINVGRRGRGEHRIEFAVLVHPSRMRESGRRAAQWQPWTEVVATPPLEWGARGTVNDLVRADAATVHEARVARALLTGPAGGDAADAGATLADTFPLALFRYLAAPHTALTVQLRPNAAALVRPGNSPANDRVALGRALLHDVGVDLAGLSGRVEAAAVVRALEEFGLFSEDGQTEFLPYWRTQGILRFGEIFRTDGGFEVDTEDPVARVRVSTFIRPAPRDAARRQALFVLVNEGRTPVREQIYIQQPQRLFGGANRVTAAAVFSRLNYERLPAESDWRRENVIRSATRYEGNPRPFSTPQLMDLESGGFVRSTSVREGGEIYGLVHVPARGMRILYGAGAF